MKNEKGSITIFVLTSMLFFLVILLSIYINNVNTNSNMSSDIKRIQSQYEVTPDDLEEAYQNIVNEIKYPEPLLDSQSVGGKDILRNSDGTYKYFDGTDTQEFPILSPEIVNGGTDFNGMNVITVSATIKTPSFSDIASRTDNYYIVGCTEWCGWDIFIDLNKKINFGVNYDNSANTNYDYLSTNTAVEANKLYNIVAIITRGKMYMYISDENGNPIFSVNNENDPLDIDFILNQYDDVETLIGGNPIALRYENGNIIDTNSGYEGYIYDVKVWDRVLTEDEINYLVDEQTELYGDQ